MSYVDDRLRPRLNWYEKRASVCKRMYFLSEGLATLASLFLVGLIHVDSIPRGYFSALAMLVAIMLGWQRLGRFGERWRLYRQYAGQLTAELHLFANHAGPYADPRSEAILVERVEAIIAREASTWSTLFQGEANLSTKIGSGG